MPTLPAKYALPVVVAPPKMVRPVLVAPPPMVEEPVKSALVPKRLVAVRAVEEAYTNCEVEDANTPVLYHVGVVVALVLVPKFERSDQFHGFVSVIVPPSATDPPPVSPEPAVTVSAPALVRRVLPMVVVAPSLPLLSVESRAVVVPASQALPVGQTAVLVARALTEWTVLEVEDDPHIVELIEVALPEAAGSYEAFTWVQRCEALRTHVEAGLFPARRSEYGSDVLERLELATTTTLEDYLKGVARRESLRAGFNRLFGQVDVLITPVTAGSPARIRHAPVLHLAEEIEFRDCLLYPSEAADGLPCVCLGGGRIL